MGLIDFTGDIQRFLVTMTFVGGFMFFIYKVGEVIDRLPLEQTNIDLNSIVIGIVTGLIAVVASISAYYFQGKTMESQAIRSRSET